MIRNTAIAALVLVCFGVSGCSSLQSSPQRVSVNTFQSKLNPGEAGVYVLRADGYFYNTPYLSIDDKRLGDMTSSSYLYAHLQPGMHQLSINQRYSEGTVSYRFNVSPGQVTYLSMGWGKLQKNQIAKPLSIDNIFAIDHGWIVTAMNAQSAQDTLSQLKEGVASPQPAGFGYEG